MFNIQFDRATKRDFLQYYYLNILHVLLASDFMSWNNYLIGRTEHRKIYSSNCIMTEVNTLIHEFKLQHSIHTPYDKVCF